MGKVSIKSLQKITMAFPFRPTYVVHDITATTILGFECENRIGGPLHYRGINRVDTSLERVRVVQDAVVNGFCDHDLHVRYNVSFVGSIVVHCNTFSSHCVDPLKHSSTRIVLYSAVNHSS